MSGLEPEERQAAMRAFLSHVDLGDCWIWQGAVKERGYPYIHVGGASWRAHRLAVELFLGPIGEGESVDHLCHNADPTCAGGTTCLHRRCVNPLHLEAVSTAVNNERARRRTGPRRERPTPTHCPQGHEYTPQNWVATKGCRRCRICSNASSAASHRRRKERLAALTASG